MILLVPSPGPSSHMFPSIYPALQLNPLSLPSASLLILSFLILYTNLIPKPSLDLHI